MRRAQIVVVAACILGLAGSAVADDLGTSVARVAKAQALAQAQAVQREGTTDRRAMLWSGGGLVAAGMGMVLWGLLHTSDGKYVTPADVSKTSNPNLVGAGAAVVAGGGALLFLGTRPGRSSSISFGPHRLTVSKGVSW